MHIIWFSRSCSPPSPSLFSSLIPSYLPPLLSLFAPFLPLTSHSSWFMGGIKWLYLHSYLPATGFFIIEWKATNKKKERKIDYADSVPIKREIGFEGIKKKGLSVRNKKKGGGYKLLHSTRDSWWSTRIIETRDVYKFYTGEEEEKPGMEWRKWDISVENLIWNWKTKLSTGRLFLSLYNSFILKRRYIG